MALGDFRNIYENTDPSIKVSTKEEITDAFSGLEYAEIKVYYPGERKASRADGFERLKKTVNLGKFTVVEFTATHNTVGTGFTNHRYNMKTVKQYIGPQGCHIELCEESVLEFLHANALKIVNPVKEKGLHGAQLYMLKVNGKTLYSTAPWYLRGHGIAASMRSTGTATQEAGQAVGLFTAYMMPNDFDEIDLRFLNNLDNRFHFSLYNNKQRIYDLLEWYCDNLYGAVSKCVSGGAKVFNKLDALSMHMSDMSVEEGQRISENGIGPVIRAKFNATNKKEDRKFKNINSWCPADIVVYDNNIKNELSRTEFNSLSDYRDWLDKKTEQNKLRLISLKLNSSKWDTVKSYTHVSNENKTNNIVIRNKKWEVTMGNIYIYVNVIENGKNNIIRLKFTTFNNDSGASIEADYYGGKQVSFGKENKFVNADIAVESFNKKENTQTMLGKAYDTLNYYLNGTNIFNYDESEFRWPKGFEDLMKTKDIMAFRDTSISPVTNKQDKELIRRYAIGKLYMEWLDNMRRYCLMKNYNDVNKAVDEYILYTIYAGKKENFGDMNFFPKYYKIA